MGKRESTPKRSGPTFGLKIYILAAQANEFCSQKEPGELGWRE